MDIRKAAHDLTMLIVSGSASKGADEKAETYYEQYKKVYRKLRELQKSDPDKEKIFSFD